MPGPPPQYQPAFPPDFLDLCQHLVRQRTAAYAHHQRARLVVLLHECPSLGNVSAAAAVDLHPNSVRFWRHRWHQGDFSLDDLPKRGRPATFSPRRASAGQGHRL